MVDSNPLQEIAVLRDRSPFRAVFKSGEPVKVSIDEKRPSPGFRVFLPNVERGLHGGESIQNSHPRPRGSLTTKMSP